MIKLLIDSYVDVAIYEVYSSIRYLENLIGMERLI